MGRIQRAGYLIEWWMGDHMPKHAHVYKDGKEVAKVQVPQLLVLKGRLNKKLRRIFADLIRQGEL
ncbi:MAG: DUF4160 domain-containing protein [Pseudomonadota bacterium]